MKRIVYLLVDKEGKIFPENEIFSTERKAQNQIDYGIKNKFYEEGVWQIQKVGVVDYSSYKAHEENEVTGEFRFFFLIVFWALWVTFFGLLFQSIDIKEQCEGILVLVIGLSSYSLSLFTEFLFKQMRRFMCFLVDIKHYLSYRKLDKEEVEKLSWIEIDRKPQIKFISNVHSES